jgi:hypothetical protein
MGTSALPADFGVTDPVEPGRLAEKQAALVDVRE